MFCRDARRNRPRTCAGDAVFGGWGVTRLAWRREIEEGRSPSSCFILWREWPGGRVSTRHSWCAPDLTPVGGESTRVRRRPRITPPPICRGEASRYRRRDTIRPLERCDMAGLLDVMRRDMSVPLSSDRSGAVRATSPFTRSLAESLPQPSRIRPSRSAMPRRRQMV